MQRRNGKENRGVLIDVGGDSPLQSCRILQRRLRGQYVVELERQDITESMLSTCGLVIIAPSTKTWDDNDIDTLHEFVAEKGGSILILGCEFNNGQSPNEKFHANLSPLLKRFGLGLGKDSIVRSVYSPKYFHPKEAVIEDSCLTEELTEFLRPREARSTLSLDTDVDSHGKLPIVYPFGCSVEFETSSRCGPILSCKDLCLPRNRPIGAISMVQDQGSVICLGSHLLVSDDYIMKEQNLHLCLGLIRLCLSNSRERSRVVLHDDQAPEFGLPLQIPQISSLAERPRVCLQESEELPPFKELFDTSQFSFTNSILPRVIDLFDELNVKHEALTLIPPQFEVPMPPLRAAVFPPSFLEPQPPPLELFDIDSEFADNSARLKQLYTKCAADDDVESFLQGSAEILGFSDQISQYLSELKTSPGSMVHLRSKAILHFVMTELTESKLIDSSHLTEQQSLGVEGNSINSQSWLNMHHTEHNDTISPDRRTHETEEMLAYDRRG